MFSRYLCILFYLCKKIEIYHHIVSHGGIYMLTLLLDHLINVSNYKYCITCNDPKSNYYNILKSYFVFVC